MDIENIYLQLLSLLSHIYMCQTAVFYGEELAKYGFGGSHPFGTHRLDAFWNKLQSESIGNIVVEDPVMAGYQAAVLFHDAEYVELVKVASRHGGVLLDKGDTPAFKGACEASLMPSIPSAACIMQDATLLVVFAYSMTLVLQSWQHAKNIE